MKLYPPPIPARYVVRPQLLEKLNEALSCRLTLVSAPAGAGKTTLVSAGMQAARQREVVAFAWLSLDEADNAPDQFWEYVLACPDSPRTLLKTSVLEQLSAPLCAAVTETKGARELLDTLERDNLFLVPLDEERGWYRYHHLFSGLLKLMLEQAYPGLTADLHRRASHWYAAQAMIPEALSHALAAGDLELADHLVSPNVLTLIECDGAGPILQRIDALPLEEMAHLPWLSIARAWVAGPGPVHDQAELFGVLLKIRDLGLQLVAVNSQAEATVRQAFATQTDQTNGLEQRKSRNTLVETNRLLLRCPEEGDRYTLERIFCDPGSMRYLGAPWTREQLAEVVTEWQTDWGVEQRWSGVLVKKGTHEVIGTAGLTKDTLAGQSGFELSWFVLPEHQKQGFATEITAELLRFAFTALGGERVVAETHPENPASNRVLEKLGFTRLGLCHHTYDDLPGFDTQVLWELTRS